MKAWICLAVALTCLNAAFGEHETCGNLLESLESTCDYPSKLTLVSKPNNRKVDEENCNAEYTKREWQMEPKIIFVNAKPNASYVLLGVDPDPPAYQKGQYYLHWLVSHIKGEDFAEGNLSKANHRQAYFGPAPPLGSGIHRYMFLAFEDTNDKSAQDIENPGRRSRFELVPWLQRQERLCGPLAGIQFRTQY